MILANTHLLLTHFSNALSSAGYVLSLPMILLGLFAGGILLMDLVTPTEWKWMNAATALAGILFSATGVVRIQFIQSEMEDSGRRLEWAFGHSLLLDHFSVYFYYLFLICAAVTVLVSASQKGVNRSPGKFYSIILLTVAGMMGMAAGFDLIVIFVGSEIASMGVYFLAEYPGASSDASPRARKLLCRLPSSAVLAFGFVLLYSLIKSTNLQLIAQGLKSTPQNHAGITLALAATAVGLSLKIGGMPFHQRLLGIFEAAPANVAGFASVAFQTAGCAMLLRIFFWGLYAQRSEYIPMLIFESGVTLVAANVSALTQTSAIRLLAYSSVAQVGFIFAAIVSLASVTYPALAFFWAFKGIFIYLLTCAVANCGAFAIVGAIPRAEIPGRVRGMEEVAGLYYRAPALAIFMTIFLVSLAGMPLSAGFYGRYFVLRSLLASGHYVFAALATFGSVAAVYYYGRMTQLMFEQVADEHSVSVGIPAYAALGIVAAFIVAAGIYPKPLLQAVEWSLRQI